ncbi:MAG: hypothetical protein UV64_C0006G0009 [Parcubacteria group bacterium GW2011_GWC1_43_11b]|nr:MAG: hypothetical protein UV50_C0004G0021 [Parcubacteria group bacterium GW2011_GWB1_42_9]KKS89429.1 MAG: hypothetical protein UV64_C0006G0009 [Parcubacteria group bacterium GW2011_GWC1_43_11b]
MKKNIFLLVGILAVLALVAILPTPAIFAETGSTLNGWMWSDNIGWISAKTTSCPSCNVIIDSTGKFSGFAWSDAVGWINFNPGDNPPATPDQAFVSMPMTGGNVTGWARACSVFTSGCSGTLKDNNQRGDWDGWIKMQAVTWDGSTGFFSGFAWGDLNLGWISMAGLSTNPVTATNYTLTVNTLDGGRLIPAGVISEPVGVSFPYVTSASFGDGVNVTLTAKSQFNTNLTTCWSGCGPTNNGSATYSCVMDSNKTVTVGCSQIDIIPPPEDLPTKTLTVTNNCADAVITDNLLSRSCSSGTCSWTYLTDLNVPLLKTAGDWTGDCAGETGDSCSLTMNADKNAGVSCSSQTNSISITTPLAGSNKIVFSRNPSSPYPYASTAFTANVSGDSATMTLGLDLNDVASGACSGSFGAIVSSTDSCPAQQDSGQISGGILSVSVTGGQKYKLCFVDACIFDGNDSLLNNRDWTISTTVNGESNPSGSFILDFNDGFYQ